MYDVELHSRGFFAIEPHTQILIAHLNLFEDGQYNAVIDIKSPASALANTNQRLFGLYHMCGLENMVRTIMGLFSFVSGLMGILITAIVVWRIRRFGVQPNAAEKNISNPPVHE